MKLLTKALLKKFDQVWCQLDEEDPIVVAHYFCVRNGWDRYATEFIEKDKVFFWFVKGFHPERWYFSLKEFEEVNKSVRFRGIERDMFRTPKRFSELRLV